MNKRYLHGFTILELMIAMFLGLFLMGAIFKVFQFSNNITSETLRANEQVENGDFALQILSQDLQRSYFFAEAPGGDSKLWVDIPSIDAAKDCIDNDGLGSFPSATGFRPLWASRVPNNNTDFIMSCLANNDASIALVPGNDYISIKRVRGLRESDDYDELRYYLNIDISHLKVSLGKVTPPGSDHWQYIHHVYYIDKQAGVSRLRRISLQKDEMNRDAIIAEGVEHMRIMFLLDARQTVDRDRSVHSIVSSKDVSAWDWGSGRVIGVKIFLLVRASDETLNYTNTDSYQLGDTKLDAFKDAYKRKVFSRILMFVNQSRGS
ncbi:prepilin-type cleavage/methylation-like protein [Psychromonas sp. CNPT3]|uniref:PilW family protein n=1 Tax=Psychromonas sp. CNPT3 TaxID=314282 RepID=UPI00006E7658|nr:PilW family protein [Psychromonas sp. CNPT3]AGH80359.1 prepilin-type cleavage/methylation-like protein [Psychromonas sp. CNPT3]